MVGWLICIVSLTHNGQSEARAFHHLLGTVGKAEEEAALLGKSSFPLRLTPSISLPRHQFDLVEEFHSRFFAATKTRMVVEVVEMGNGCHFNLKLTPCQLPLFSSSCSIFAEELRISSADDKRQNFLSFETDGHSRVGGSRNSSFAIKNDLPLPSSFFRPLTNDLLYYPLCLFAIYYH